MPVKTTFRGGGGKDGWGRETPEHFEHLHPRVTSTDSGQMRMGESSSTAPVDNWRPFPPGVDPSALGWKTRGPRFDNPQDAIKPGPSYNNPEDTHTQGPTFPR